jgi:response regulator of citrate/malate metabolism
MQLGTVHYLVKPFTFAQIQERLIAYKDLRSKLARTTEAEQHEVDALYRLLRGPAAPPKGQSGPTMATIRELLQAAPQGVSATEVAEQIGISRATAQRYLAELARQGRAELRLHYGATGRPEHRYQITTPPG